MWTGDEETLLRTLRKVWARLAQANELGLEEGYCCILSRWALCAQEPQRNVRGWWFIIKLTRWINKHLTHSRDVEGDFGVRVIVHIPIGVIMSIPILGWGLINLFLTYERNEDIHTEDQAWKDIFGAIVGFVIGLSVQGIILWRII